MDIFRACQHLKCFRKKCTIEVTLKERISLTHHVWLYDGKRLKKLGPTFSDVHITDIATIILILLKILLKSYIRYIAIIQDTFLKGEHLCPKM
jgi:hypothetical protein